MDFESLPTDVVLKHADVALLVVARGERVHFHLLHYDNGWEERIVVEGVRPEVNFSLVDHHSSLLVVEGFLVLNHLRVTLTDDGDDEVHEDHEQEEDRNQPDKEREYHYNCDDEVHEDHEQEEDRNQPDKEREYHYNLTMPVLTIVNDVKAHVRIDYREVSHGTPEHIDEVREQLRGSTILLDVHFDDVEALGKSQAENKEEDHEVSHLLDHCDEHGHEEVQLPEYSQQVHYFHQAEHYRQREQDPHPVGDLFHLQVQDRR
eukprot:CAMPEP_0170510324 /NCGR_PEP_ID=MMETSP0208-20121228/65702_1 /TAXON_ID=197538 /ORGANISM="Strombidium inclinatum, Strain S3" /LENGTH=260 /DNA_ID=CAMNT_0010793775 /DNA_START=2129 /DNA_END=2907 /DNA_ORIENTATION=+